MKVFMFRKTSSLLSATMLVAVAFWAGRMQAGLARSRSGALTAQDYAEITQLINRYAYGIDTCGGNGFDYANVFTPDGVFIDKNSDAGYATGGRVLARGRQALAEQIGGCSKGCKTKQVWTDWSHLMLTQLNLDIEQKIDVATVAFTRSRSVVRCEMCCCAMSNELGKLPNSS